MWKKTWFKAALSALLAVGGLFLLQRLLVPKYVDDVVEGAFIAEYYREEDKNFDAVFIGDCEVYENFSPVVLWQDYGINSYIRGSAQQYIWQSYYLLEDTLRYETPQAVIFNVLSLQYNESQSEAYNRMTLEGMEWSSAKVKAIRASMRPEEQFLDYVFPLLRYHSRWSGLTAADARYLFDTKPVSHNGYYMRVDARPAQDVPKGKPLGDYRFGENAWSYLEKMRDLCAEKGIELILIKAPSLYPYWYEEWDRQVRDFAGESGLTYLNFLDLAEEVGIDYATDTYDGGLHMNLSGAEKLSHYMGRFLREQAGLPDRRGESELAAAWEPKIAAYEAEIAEQCERYGIQDYHGDTEPPVITGAEDLTAEAGGTVSYRAGVSARDEVDGPVKLQVDAGQVDLSIPGTYPVVYSAVDARGNRAEVTVTLTVIQPAEEDEPTAPEGTEPAEPVQVDQATLDALADDVLAKITTADMSAKQKAKAIFNYVYRHIKYVGTSDKSSWITGAYVGLTRGRGDCYNYFAASKALLTRAGIPNVDLERTGGRTHHYWQLVNVGDGWYHFDACPHPTGYPLVSFLLTEAEARAYTERCKSRTNYYVYDYESCPVTVVEGTAPAPQPAEPAPQEPEPEPVQEPETPQEPIPEAPQEPVQEPEAPQEPPAQEPGDPAGDPPAEDQPREPPTEAPPSQDVPQEPEDPDLDGTPAE